MLRVKRKTKNISEILKDRPELYFMVQVMITQGAQSPTITKDFDLKELVRLVKHHRLNSLFYTFAQKQNIPLPKALKIKLEKINQHNKMRMMQLTAELLRIHKLLTENGINYISLKGPALSQQIYGDYTLRSSNDLDILVDVNDTKKAKILLQKLAYQTKDSLSSLARFNDKELKFVNTKNNIVLELHHRFFNNKYLLDFSSSVFENSTISTINQSEIRVLDPVYNFLYLSAHAAAHNWSRLTWVFDILNFKSQLTTEELQQSKRLAEELGLSKIYRQAVNFEISNFLAIAREDHYHLHKKMMFLMGLNTKAIYKWQELLQRAMVPYRFVSKYL